VGPQLNNAYQLKLFNHYKPDTIWYFFSPWDTDHLRNLYAGQEATVRTGHGTTDWFQIGKGVRQGCILSSAYLRLLIFLPAILIPACVSSSPAFLMMYSAYKLNKQDDNIQP